MSDDTLLGGEAAADTTATTTTTAGQPDGSTSTTAAGTTAPGTDATGDAAAVETPEAKAAREAAEAKPAGAPEAYADFVTPEGAKLDGELLGEFKELAKASNLPQDQAQKFADLAVKMNAQMAGKNAEVLQAAKTEWAGQARADKEFGGAAFNANLAIANKALDTFGTPALKQMLKESGLGNHPELLRAFFRAGKSISEDTFVGGGNSNAARTDQDRLSVMYPTMTATH